MQHLLRGEQEPQSSPGCLDVRVICAAEEQVGQLACPGDLFDCLRSIAALSDKDPALEKTSLLFRKAYA